MRLPCPPALYEPGSAGRPGPTATMAGRAPRTDVQTPEGEIERFGRAPLPFALSPRAVEAGPCIPALATVLRPAGSAGGRSEISSPGSWHPEMAGTSVAGPQMRPPDRWESHFGPAPGPPEHATGWLCCGSAGTREPPFFALGASCAGVQSAFAGPGAGAGAGPVSDPAHRARWRRQSSALRRGPRRRDPRSHTGRATRGWRSCVPVAG